MRPFCVLPSITSRQRSSPSYWLTSPWARQTCGCRRDVWEPTRRTPILIEHEESDVDGSFMLRGDACIKHFAAAKKLDRAVLA